jgi:tetratricopeptide (TPR) repeat protein
MVSTPPPPADEHADQAPLVHQRGTYRMLNGVHSLDRSLQVLEYALGEPASIPEPLLRRTRLRSDAMRLMGSGQEEQLRTANTLFTQAIELELEGEVASPPCGGGDPERVRELRMMRGGTRGHAALRDWEGSIADFDAVLEEEPTFTRALLEKAKVLRRARKPAEALECFRRALHLGTSLPPPPNGFGMHQYMVGWLQKIVEELEERLLEDDAISSGEFGTADAGDEGLSDSGDGSGRWKLERIEDTCVYHLVNHRPAMPHPFPHEAWHINVRFGGVVREYTPVSTAAEWEDGKLSLLVKTYEDGALSRKFALLRQASPWASAEEQPCWVLCSAPALTLALPGLTEQPPEVAQMLHPNVDPSPPLTHLCLVVGGTGIAPAVQILREVALGGDGAFASTCQATLLYSSRTPQDAVRACVRACVRASAARGRRLERSLSPFHPPLTSRDSAPI